MHTSHGSDKTKSSSWGSNKSKVSEKSKSGSPLSRISFSQGNSPNVSGESIKNIPEEKTPPIIQKSLHLVFNHQIPVIFEDSELELKTAQRLSFEPSNFRAFAADDQAGSATVSLFSQVSLSGLPRRKRHHRKTSQESGILASMHSLQSRENRASIFEQEHIRPTKEEIVNNLERYFPDIKHFEVSKYDGNSTEDLNLQFVHIKESALGMKGARSGLNLDTRKSKSSLIRHNEALNDSPLSIGFTFKDENFDWPSPVKKQNSIDLQTPSVEDLETTRLLDVARKAIHANMLKEGSVSSSVVTLESKHVPLGMSKMRNGSFAGAALPQVLYRTSTDTLSKKISSQISALAPVDNNLKLSSESLSPRETPESRSSSEISPKHNSPRVIIGSPNRSLNYIKNSSSPKKYLPSNLQRSDSRRLFDISKLEDEEDKEKPIEKYKSLSSMSQEIFYPTDSIMISERSALSFDTYPNKLLNELTTLDDKVPETASPENGDFEPPNKQESSILSLKKQTSSKASGGRSGFQSVARSYSIAIKEELIKKVEDSQINPTKEAVTWYRGDRIGRGAYGTVYVAINLKNWELIAVKQVETQTLARLQNGKNVVGVAHEMEILRDLVHPNIVTYKGT